MPAAFVARPVNSPRLGLYYSLRCVNRDTGGDIEFAKVRQEDGYWSVWMEDRDMERVCRQAVRSCARHAPVEIVARVVRTAYYKEMTGA